MPVTELALLQLKAQDAHSSTKIGLLEAQKKQTGYSEYQVTYLRQIEDPSFFYLLGGWESVEKHTGEGQWLSSEVNQDLLARLQSDLDVSWMFHLDVDPSTSKIPLDAPVLAITRCFVEAGRKDEFDAVFKAVVSHLNAYTAPFSVCGAWRIDKEGQDEEFVLFSGWNEIQDHIVFGESEASREFGKLKALMKDAEVKHVHVEKWE
ncbi:hypothetical protein N7516_000150 [Penicillium verrucosum]|uniref:uncharacterized protein n=1 Tax=Penicillium verrucosum TaxID=60171 RepID=UPI002544F683|nr:uncharacterized protein N7516_000150 [Penicillium verrucosum]KAJ5939982.1 hypothetical protein N7516_000150 [Penicillium verrucosum]